MQLKESLDGFQILKPADKKKFPYSGIAAGGKQPAPPRGGQVGTGFLFTRPSSTPTAKKTVVFSMNQLINRAIKCGVPGVNNPKVAALPHV